MTTTLVVESAMDASGCGGARSATATALLSPCPRTPGQLRTRVSVWLSAERSSARRSPRHEPRALRHRPGRWKKQLAECVTGICRNLTGRIRPPDHRFQKLESARDSSGVIHEVDFGSAAALLSCGRHRFLVCFHVGSEINLRRFVSLIRFVNGRSFKTCDYLNHERLTNHIKFNLLVVAQ